MNRKKLLLEAGPMMDVKKTGVGYFVGHLSLSLQKNYSSKLDITGYFYNFLKLNEETVDSSGIQLHRIWLMPGKILSVFRRLGFQPFLEIFTLKKADWILFTNYVSLPTLRRHKKALIIYDLGFLDYPEYMQDRNLKYLKRFCPPSIRKADLIITISEFTKSRLDEHFPELKAKIVVTPIPPVQKSVSKTNLSPNLTAKGIKAQSYILYIGTIEPRKNIQNLVKAYAAMDKTVSDKFALVIAGGKGWKDESIIEEVEKLKQQGFNIIMPGYVSEEDKNVLYANASCFVLPSHYEGFGMPILESMQYGIPVAVSDIPVFHEVAGKGASYFNKDSIESIADAVENILTDNGLRGRLLDDASTQLEKFSWDNNSAVVFDALSNIK